MLDSLDLAVLSMCAGGVDLPKDIYDDQGEYLLWVKNSLVKLSALGYMGRDESMTQLGIVLMSRINECLDSAVIQ